LSVLRRSVFKPPVVNTTATALSATIDSHHRPALLRDEMWRNAPAAREPEGYHRLPQPMSRSDRKPRLMKPRAEVKCQMAKRFIEF
jgi:hypothetical protein